MRKQIEKIVYIVLCGLGGCIIGVSAKYLNTLLGIVFFSMGVFMLAISSYKIAKF